MDGRTWQWLAWLGAFCGVVAFGGASGVAQQARQAGTLVIAGQQDQAPLTRINGRSYIDLESLARLTHGTLQFEGSRAILTLPHAGTAAAANADEDTKKPPRLTEGFLGAEIEALTQIREWHVSLVNAVQNNYAITEKWVGPMQRNAEAKLQLASAATHTEPDQQAAQLLRNEFANMQQMSDQLLAMHDKASNITPEIFNNNTLDAKILGCEQALATMAASKQFQDEPQCH